MTSRAEGMNVAGLCYRNREANDVWAFIHLGHATMNLERLGFAFAATAILLCAEPNAADGAFVLQEDFASVADWSNDSGTALSTTPDPSDAGNTVGTDGSIGGSRNSRSITGIADETIGTIFLRFQIPTPASGAPDFGFEFGESAANNTQPISIFASGPSPQILTNPFLNPEGNLAFDTWYNMWIVVDNIDGDASADTYTVYLGGGAFGAQSLIVTEDFSNTAGNGSLVVNSAIDTVQFREFSRSLLIDDLYVDTAGENLASPLAALMIPEPSSLVLCALALIPALRRRRHIA